MQVVLYMCSCTEGLISCPYNFEFRASGFRILGRGM